MAEKDNNAEKQKKNRSLGAFLLFLTVLVLILITLGRHSASGSIDLTHDELEYYLQRGDVAKIEVGRNQVVGEFKDQARDDATRFKVAIPEPTPELVDHYRTLAAVSEYKSIQAQDLLAAIEAGVYSPIEARTLRAISTAPGAEASKEPQTQTVREELLVRTLARQQSADAPRRFPEPKSGGTLDLRVEGEMDIAAVSAALAQAGAPPRILTFNLSKTGGTAYEPSDGLFQQFLFLWAPWLLIFIVFLLFMRQMRSQGGAGGVMSFGRSRATLYTKENHTNVTFDDVAGAQEAKDEVREVVEFLKNPSRFTRIGGRIPRGVLLVGPPGCGKTLLAKAIAGEAEVPFFSISGSDFVEMFVGVGASRVRDLFKQARENSPCIIFLDEIDAVGRRRGSGMGGGHDEREQTLNAILVEMDGFGTDEGIIVIAATNRPDVLDPALLRPGRFDREVVIDLPDVEGREEILRVHLKKVKTGPDVDVKTLARLTPGYSGADLAAIINEAAIRAALNKKEHIGMEDLDEAREKVRYGRQKRSRKLEVEDKKITAFHEAGHTVVASSIPEVDKPHKVTIVPRGRSLGATWVLPDKESYHMQRKRLVGQLAWMFGGRVAEEEFCGDVSAGASDDIKRATALARAMVTELGMSDKIGPINYAEREGSDFLGAELMRGRDHSEQTAREIDEEVKRLLTDAHVRARGIVREKRSELERIAEALLLYETITGDEITRLIKGDSVSTLRPTPPAAPGGAPVSPERKSAAKPASEGKLGDLPGRPGLSPA